MYRPFTKQWLYFSRTFNDMIYQVPKIFPRDSPSSENRVICFPNKGEDREFSVVMNSVVPDLHLIHGGQCFPRYIYESPAARREGELLLDIGSHTGDNLTQCDAITDSGIAHFEAAYPSETITKDDLFYYIYGVLHSEDYRSRFADNLSKQLPRIPAVRGTNSFWRLVDAGRRLADLHVDYENVEPYGVTVAQGDLRLASMADPEAFYRVEQMKFAGQLQHHDDRNSASSL